jgi:putative intracellular protease/amidase
MVLTSHDELGDTGDKTGFWLEEFAAPYYVLKDAGHDITLASPAGGKPPLDPKSDEPDAQTAATERYKKDSEAQGQLASTEKLADVDVASFDGVFYPGGHGPLWDLAESAVSKAVIEDTLAAGKPVALVCHAPAVLKNVTAPNGDPIVKGRKVTGFTNQEEDAVGLTDVVPFLLEDVLIEQGGTFSKQGVFEPYVVQDGLLITGQNPPSSEPAAEKLLEALKAD